MNEDKDETVKFPNFNFSGATIVIFIALGALVLVLLFIFAKRQIMRFTLRRYTRYYYFYSLIEEETEI